MKKGKVLSLDYGSKRIGMASGNFLNKIATPFGVVENKGASFVLEKILNFCKEWEIETIVVGLPLAMEDKQNENMIMGQMKNFVKKLKEVSHGIEIVLIDERLSSFEAQKLIEEAKERVGDDFSKDAISAQIILERFFNQI